MRIDPKALQTKRARVLGDKYRIWVCSGCGRMFGNYIPTECECGVRGVTLINAATKRNFYLDIAEELTDVMEIIERAREREDLTKDERGYLKSIYNDIEDSACEVLALEGSFPHRDEYPVERVLTRDTLGT